jgi:CHAT domain-containing protein/tetratricopeptide (TPR) repeat protein
MMTAQRKWHRPSTIAAFLSILTLLLFAEAAVLHESDLAPEALEDAVYELAAQGDYEEAVEKAKQLVDLRKMDPESMEYEIADSERLVETLSIVSALPEDQKQRLALSDSMLEDAYGFWDESKFDEAVAEAKHSLDIKREIFGDKHPDVAIILDNLAALLIEKGDYAGAELYFQDARSVARNLMGETHPIVGIIENNYAMLKYRMGEYGEAEKLHREVLSTWIELFGEENLNVAASFNNLSLALQYQGEFEEAEGLCRRALAIRRELLGPRDPEVAESLNNLSSLVFARRDYAAAEPLFREAVAILRSTLGERHPRVALYINNLGSLLYSLGDYDKAEELHREALAIYREVFGDKHPSVALALYNLAHAIEDQGNDAAAEPLFREALEMRRELLSEDHPDIASSMNGYAHLLQTMMRFQAADSLYRDALQIRRQTFGDEHPDVATTLSNMASLHEAMKDYSRAEELFREALMIRQKSLGTENAAVAHSLSSIGHVLLAQHEYGEAEVALAEATATYDIARLRGGTGLRRATMALRMRPPAAALAVSMLEQGKKSEAWGATERSLARSLADLLSVAEERRLSEEEKAREDSLKTRLTTLEQELVQYREAARMDPTTEKIARAEETRNHLLDAEAEWSGFQNDMAERYTVTEGRTHSLDRVQHSLSRQTALLGWLDVEVEEGEHSSWAYVIRNSGPVHWSRVGRESNNDGLTSVKDTRSFRRLVADPGSPIVGVNRDGRTLWSEFIDPVSDALDGVEELVVIPSGRMLGIPVEAFVDNEGVSVGEKFAVSYVPSATIHCWLFERARDSRRMDEDFILLLGDPPYNEAHMLAMENESGAGMDDSEIEETGNTRSGERSALGSLPRLGATRDEVYAVAALSEGASVLVGPDASEQALVRLAETGDIRSFRSIHLATHAIVDDERPERSALVLSQVGLPDPLEAAMKGERVYDGLLTVKEIIREWDLDADLVVLSACETALGKEVAGEGYIGFAHAFLQAGAGSQLVSLWKVEDRATSLLMQRFYQNRLGAYDDERAGRTKEPMSKSEALRESKIWLRNYTDETGRKPYEHPYFWSAFILIGEHG